MNLSAVSLRRQCRTWSRKKGLIYFLVFTSLIILTFKFILQEKNNIETQPSCIVPKEQRPELYNLLNAVSEILTKLSITHFLCFDSLWGAVQESGPLPWDPNAHLCALNEKVAVHDEAELLRAFRRHGLILEYSSAEGQYTIRNSSLERIDTVNTAYIGEHFEARIQVTLFEEDERVLMFRRVGWKRRVLPPDCDAHPSLQCFPPGLAATPLPKRSFGPLKMPAPREDIDLLKFHYPTSWWRPLQPNC